MKSSLWAVNRYEKSKVCRDVLSKWSINTEKSGEMWVPKSIDVVALNAASVQEKGTFAVGKRRRTVGEGVVTVSVNPNVNVLHTKATPAYEEELAKLSGRVDAHDKIKIEHMGELYICCQGDKLLFEESAYRFPVFKNLDDVKKSPLRHSQPLLGEDGKPKEFGQEILQTFLIPKRRFGGLKDFWQIEAHTVDKNKIDLDAIGFAEDATVHMDLIVIYRER